jgi:hypothetical protein|tara:strand:+ start:6309 stop:6509 length:201 start_codon:yes stop_codon:yes gene_type:complete
MIGGGRTIMHLPDPMNHSGVKENTLGKRGLSRINVRSNPNVPCPLKRNGAGWGLRNFAHQTSGKKN